MEYTTHSAEETERVAGEILAQLLDRAGEPGTATIVGLSGELGSGKTTFMKGVARELGVQENVTSPTFVIEKIYELQDSPFAHLIHIDAYRIEDPQELVSLGFHEILANPKNLIFVEWPERVAEIMPLRAKELTFEVVDENTRKISGSRFQ